ncbi:helix-turn-helix transcriptional regulator [Microbacterium sp. 1P10UB]|uniref:helix-turn-helix transcriptional regulator n=1 Tax=unclassified Microbacterium TaxID=2609290 RepID=UPI0039A148E3
MDAVDTRDVDQAGEILVRTFPGLQIAGDRDGRPFRFRYSREDLGPLTRTRMRVQGLIRTSGLYPDHVAAGRRHSGRVGIRYDDHRLNTGGPYLRPAGWSIAEFDSSDVELIIVDRARFRHGALRLLEGSGQRLREPRPDQASARSGEAGRVWAATADLVSSSISGGSTLNDELLAELVVSSLLTCFALTEPIGVSPGSAVAPRAVRRAAEYIHENLSEPLTIARIAEAAGVPPRTLHAGFRRHLQTTPLRYLRLARLHAVRDELTQTPSGEVTLADVCRRWGFAHPSRFAAAYRHEFGQNPSQTQRSAS